MRGLRAAVYKDIKLFLRGTGLLALVLPLLLLPALRWGMGDLAAQSSVRPFPIAVRDLDGTVMSRSLVSQLRQVQLFSEVRELTAEDTDQAALDAGAAAAVTIPRDFFYELYTMADCPVTVTLNGAMGLESSLFQTVFRAVMGIVRADQAAQLGLHTFLYGPPDDQQLRTLFDTTAQNLFQDVLGRQNIFDAGAETADLAGALQRRLLACILSVCALFFALSAAKTLPEEASLGVLGRFRALGGRLGAFLFSKLCAAFLMTVPVLALAAALLPAAGIGCLLALDALLLWAAFGLQTALAAWSGSAAAAQRWGNILMLLSLAAGGALWPRTALPAPMALLGRLTLPYYACLGLEAWTQRFSFGELAGLLWPLVIMGAAGLALAVPGLRRRRADRAPAVRAASPTQSSDLVPAPAAGTGRRLAGLGLFKLRAVSGGAAGLAVTLAAALFCGVASASVRSASTDVLRLAVCDEDGTALSTELAASIAGEEGVQALAADLPSARRALVRGEIEGILVIGAGYADALAADQGGALRYESASSSLSIQGAREVAAGKSSAQRSVLRAQAQAEQALGRPLDEAERGALAAAIAAAEETIPALYVLDTADGTPLPPPFVPGQMSFAALTVLFTLLTAASWCGSAGARLTERRMLSLPRGRLVAYASDCLALALLGGLVMAAALLPGGDAASLPAAALYVLAAAALALALVRFTALAGRVDALAPLLALLLCLAGGCFMDLGQLSPAMDALSLLSPAGLAVRAADGSAGASAALAAVAAALFVLGMPRREK